MTSQAAAETAAEAAAPGSKDGAWKWAIRKRIWDYMEESNIARCVNVCQVVRADWDLALQQSTHVPGAAVATCYHSQHQQAWYRPCWYKRMSGWSYVLFAS
eukprot:GHRR01032382.1.p1 GENE.GHRR01032382.1~~GHRR01032382.1.p1  ORF type:complete len:116 (+),score=40.44 GHRR01032382.1:48-350(+)